MKTNVLGFPRIGQKRELKKANEAFWKNTLSEKELLEVAKNGRKYAWNIQKENNISLISSNDFSFYDHVLDASFTFGVIPERYHSLFSSFSSDSLEVYFAMARGYQKDGHDIIAMEMTKWFDTNYHYIVPEFTKNQKFSINHNKPLAEFLEAKEQGIVTKPVLLSPVTFLLLGKEKEEGFNKLDLLPSLLSQYHALIQELVDNGVKTIQFDEPFFALDLDNETKDAITQTYIELRQAFPELEMVCATYFEGLKENAPFACSLPVDVLHLDLVRDETQATTILEHLPSYMKLSLGVVDGRNIWKNDFKKSLSLISSVTSEVGPERVVIGTSCSLLHSPYDLDLETDENALPSEIKDWMAFAKQKVAEVSLLAELALEENPSELATEALKENSMSMQRKANSGRIHRDSVKERLASVKAPDFERENAFRQRKEAQKVLNLPLFPSTTIGSFPQTKEIRRLRLKFKKGEITESTYVAELEKATDDCIAYQENIGIDVLVHGEFERTDMVEYFGEKLDGFVFSKFGWVQSYGSRGVKPPIVFGDVERPEAMTVKWAKYAQSKTQRHMKGMLTGPVTILQWSFVRNDQPRKDTAMQIALAIRDEVTDLEKGGIDVIQIDEPAIREGLPLRNSDKKEYLKWAIDAFKLCSSSVKDRTQIHTHMCYSEFNEMIEDIARMDADVITIETSRSQMELLDVFKQFNYPNEIGPGVYDIHSPRVPTTDEMKQLLEKALAFIPKENLWVNPDCGLKTRAWEETKKALENMVSATKKMREAHS